MTHDTVTSTREALRQDTDRLKHDAGKTVEDVKKHASAHVDAVKEKVTDAFDLARDFVKEHPVKLTLAALFIGFMLETFRRK